MKKMFAVVVICIAVVEILAAAAGAANAAGMIQTRNAAMAELVK